MRKLLIIICSAILLASCQSVPKNYSHFYTSQDTGLDSLINIDGYYVMQRECDSTFFSVVMFYPDGLFTIATTSELMPELINCFEQGGTSLICRYPSWGTYIVERDTIRTQTIVTDGHGCIIFRDYRILADKSIVNISDYVDHKATNLGYMNNYPSFRQNNCSRSAIFTPFNAKRYEAECPFINKKWFRQK